MVTTPDDSDAALWDIDEDAPDEVDLQAQQDLEAEERAANDAAWGEDAEPPFCESCGDSGWRGTTPCSTCNKDGMRSPPYPGGGRHLPPLNEELHAGPQMWPPLNLSAAEARDMHEILRGPAPEPSESFKLGMRLHEAVLNWALHDAATQEGATAESALRKVLRIKDTSQNTRTVSFRRLVKKRR